MTLRTTIVAAALIAASASGCVDPYAGDPQRRPATVAGEVPAPTVRQPAERLSALPPTPEAAARRAAELTTTWTSADAARRYAELATFSTGAARRDAHDAAARLPTDAQLEGSSSDGDIAAIITRSAGAHDRELLVVTRETLRADGLVDRRWRVTLASVERRRGGWALSRWEPQP